MKKIIVLLMIVSLLSCVGITVLYAQPLPPAPTAPISGGLGILIISGIVYGLKKYFSKNKK